MGKKLYHVVMAAKVPVSHQTIKIGRVEFEMKRGGAAIPIALSDGEAALLRQSGFVDFTDERA